MNKKMFEIEIESEMDLIRIIQPDPEGGCRREIEITHDQVDFLCQWLKEIKGTLPEEPPF
jgi:hypothetical protein